MPVTLRKRIDRLAQLQGAHSGAGPAVVFLCDAATGEAGGALLKGGGGFTREAGECDTAFRARVDAACAS